VVESWQLTAAAQWPAARLIDRFTEFIAQRAPEVGWNGVVLHRELIGLGFSGTYQQVRHFLQPIARCGKRSTLATVRFETAPEEPAQVDYGQLQVFIGEQPETVHLFVLTLGYARRVFTRAYREPTCIALIEDSRVIWKSALSVPRVNALSPTPTRHARSVSDFVLQLRLVSAPDG
jgi:hypothetical protein